MRKVAVVTGSTKGIGLAISRTLLRHNCKVILNYTHDETEANRVNESLKSEFSPDSFKIIKSDLSKYFGMGDFVKEIYDFSPSIDYLILNVGMTDRDSFQDITIKNWQEVMDVNLNIPFFLIQRLSENINRNGRIIFIGSIMGIYPHSLSISYGVSKSATHFLAKVLVKEFSNKQITVNVIAPGFVDTEWQQTKEIEHRKRIESKINLNRFALPEEIAQITISIIQNDYINGAIIPVDGGYCAG